MKRILISAVAAGALLGQLGAAEIYKDGDKSFGVFGTVRGIVGYGYNFSKSSESSKFVRGTYPSEFIYGIQTNSRIGVNFTLGNVFGAALIGANEQTFRNGSDVDSTGHLSPGFRQLYAGYNFGDAGKLLVGKNELVTSMAGFSSSIFDTDSGLNGFGGTSTSTRRFQIAYEILGLTVSVSENDVNGIGALGNKSFPRLSVGYEYNADGLRAKIAASYANAQRKQTQHLAIITAGVKANFGDSYVSGLFNYGLNSEALGESKVNYPSLARGYGNLGVASGAVNSQGTRPDRDLVGIALEFGTNLTSDFAVKVGGGYQYASDEKKNDEPKGGGTLHSYAAFVQLPYSVGKGFSIIPQVGYLGTTTNTTTNGKKTSNNVGNVLAEVQFNLTF